jgi:hypothetical protein
MRRPGHRNCTHPLYEYRNARAFWRRHPDGRPLTYSRCATCHKLLWRAWEQWPFNASPWRKARLRLMAWSRLSVQDETGEDEAR